MRLPRDYRVTGDSVYVKRLGNSIVLTPKTGQGGLFIPRVTIKTVLETRDGREELRIEYFCDHPAVQTVT